MDVSGLLLVFLTMFSVWETSKISQDRRFRLKEVILTIDDSKDRRLLDQLT